MLHRDISYFFLGLIISFSLSGIVLAHRGRGISFDKYEVSKRSFNIDLHKNFDVLSPSFPKDLATSLGIKNAKSHRLMIMHGKLTMSYMDQRVTVDLKTGKGTVTEYKSIPIIAEMRKLHTSTDDSWQYYADFFAIGMLCIAITGVIIPMGKKGFKKRGWKFTLAGIIFPLIIAIFVI